MGDTLTLIIVCSAIIATAFALVMIYQKNKSAVYLIISTTVPLISSIVVFGFGLGLPSYFN